MATRERLAQTSNLEYTNIQYMATRNACGSNEQSGIHKYSINGHKRTPGSGAIWNTQIFNKWPKENAWLKRAIWNTEIWNTEIINKWPQENARLNRAIWNIQTFNKWPQENACGSNGQYGKQKYSINGRMRTPGSNEQYGIQECARERLAQTSNMDYRNMEYGILK